MKAWHNGEFVEWEETKVHLLSHGFSRGSALFEVLDVLSNDKGTAAFGLKEHVERLFNSARLSFMDLTITPDELINHVKESIRINNVKKGMVKFFAYYSDIELKITPASPKVSLTIFAVDYDQQKVDSKKLSEPVRVKLSSFRKNHPESVPAHAKVTGNYLNPYIAKMEALKEGYEDVIFLDTMGFVAEGTTSNLFLVKGGQIFTPALRAVLPGITRAAIMDILASKGATVKEIDLLPKDLWECSEAFFTSSIVKVQPIRSCNGKDFGDRCPGPVTENAINWLAEVYRGESESLERWLTYVD